MKEVLVSVGVVTVTPRCKRSGRFERSGVVCLQSILLKDMIGKKVRVLVYEIE